MSLKKQYLKSKPLCKVTFHLTKQQAKKASKVSLLGDFNDWDRTATPMKQLKSGDFTTTINLPKDNSYHFRYLLDDAKWEIDCQADALVKSPISQSDNSVINV
ncbi:isoamylase early set domain-containing protein [Flocculibacter collagenilyticus]|uniref:isoamylase early set domain-containing protein n=1 Tax=Flocculibacter collagenilyticus TaxID=2744479 RepID=UPI0018F6AA16|nr:isoamylase early set domain-containing protein [Flocculibacter collagenilyticus]